MKENKDGKQLKTEPKLKVQLNDEQKEFVKMFYEFDVCFLFGDFGTDRSFGMTCEDLHGTDND